METILAKIEAHEAETQRLNDELLAERDATQAKIEQLTAYRYELDSIIQRRGIRPNMEADRHVHSSTNDSRIVKRTPREKAEYISSVPVETEGKISLQRLIRNICADGQKRTKAEIVDIARQRRPDINPTSFDTMFARIGLFSCPNDRPGAKRGTRLYWFSSANVN